MAYKVAGVSVQYVGGGELRAKVGNKRPEAIGVVTTRWVF